MSISGGGGAGGAAEYHAEHLEHGDYYSANPGIWHPTRASRRLALPTRVTRSDFSALAEGKSPQDNPLVQGVGRNHRSGWDCTFSAPKSVSVLWSQLPAPQRLLIEQAHARSVDAALGMLEREAVKVRRGKGGVAQESAAMVAAKFQHDTSRALDPQLHTHAYVMNCALRTDGGWGAIESKNLYKWQTAVGTGYRAELAQQLRLLGYDIAADARSFRVVGIPQAVCEQFSKRRAAITERADAVGASSPAGMESIALGTRARKVTIDAEELRDRWRREGEAIGFVQANALTLANARPSTIRAIDLSEILDDLTAHRATFRRQDLWRAVAERVQVSGGGLRTVEDLVLQCLSGPDAVALVDDRYTTRQMLALEAAALRAARTLHETSGHACQRVESGRTLSDEQDRALTHLLGDHGLKLIEGRAGTGKSYLLGAARACWEAAGVRVLGAALAGKAAEGLTEGSGIPAQTLHSLLAELERGTQHLDARTVVVLDEAGMVGTAQMARLLAFAAGADAQVVLVGDSRQLQSIDAGGVFSKLSEDLGAVELVDIRRQQNPDDKAAVVALMDGEATAALENLSERGRVHVCDGRPSTIGHLVDDWANVFDPAKPAATLMLAATRVDVRSINQEARRVLRERGVLIGEDAVLSGNPYAVGDRILFLRNDRGLGVKNGTLGMLRGCEGTTLTVELDGGRTIAVDTSVYSHITHGYAVTAHKAQGVTTDDVFLYVTDQMETREWAYVAASRHRHEVHLYADRSVYADLAVGLAKSNRQTLAMSAIPTGSSLRQELLEDDSGTDDAAPTM